MNNKVVIRNKVFFFMFLILLLSSCIDDKVKEVKNNELINSNSKTEKVNGIIEESYEKKNSEVQETINNSENETIIKEQKIGFRLCSEKPFLDKNYKSYFCIKSDGVYYI
jgi:hypothetical protein